MNSARILASAETLGRRLRRTAVTLVAALCATTMASGSVATVKTSVVKVPSQQVLDDLKKDPSLQHATALLVPAEVDRKIFAAAEVPPPLKTVPIKVAEIPAPGSVRLQQLVRRAQQASGTEDLAAAWNAVEVQARADGDAPTAAQAGLQQARVLELTGALSPRTAADNRTAAIAKYREVVAESAATPSLQSQARNNLGVLYLQEKNLTAARDVLGGIDWAKADPDRVPLFRYNLGRAEELADNGEAALEQYRAALKVRPDSRPAGEGAFRVLVRLRRYDQMADVADGLSAHGQAALVRQQLHRSILDVGTLPGGRALLSSLVRAYAALPLTPPDFEKQEQSFLTAVSQKVPALESSVTQIRSAYAAPSRGAILSEGSAFDTYSRWHETARDREAMSALLQSIGSYLLQQDAPVDENAAKRALTAFSTAWSLDHANTDAALYAATILQSHRATVDPSGNALENLVAQIFDFKSKEYKIPVKTAEDLANLMRLHLTLAGIYETSTRWGSIHDPESAIFQLDRAISIEDQLRKMDPSFPPSTGLRTRLAQAYVSAHEPAQAYAWYLQSARLFRLYQDEAQAQAALNAAGELPLDREQKLQMATRQEDILLPPLHTGV